MTHRSPRQHDPWSVRDRMYRDVQTSVGRGGRIALATGAISLGVLLLIASYSLYQVSEEDRAMRLIEHGVASVTDIDTYLAESLPALREAAADTDEEFLALPGYPLDVRLSAEEVRSSDDGELRATLLRRSAAQVHQDGLAAFSQEGGQSLGAVTAENLIDFFLSLLRDPAHSRAAIATIVFALLVGASAAVVAASDMRPGVLRPIGGAMLGGSLTGLALSVGVVFLLGRIGGDDAFTRDIGGIAQSIVEVPRRNFLIASVFSAILFGAGWGFVILERRAEAVGEPATEDWWDGEYAYDDDDEDGLIGDTEPEMYADDPGRR